MKNLKRIIAFILTALSLLTLNSCGGEEVLTYEQITAQGTYKRRYSYSGI